jgi:hypothetical protein
VTPVSGDGETWHADSNITVLDNDTQV